MLDQARNDRNLMSSQGMNGHNSGGATINSGVADAILKAFNTWAFKREQPTEPNLLLSTIRHRAEFNLPIQFVLYWGKGPRTNVAAPDLRCLDFLGAMRERICAVYPNGVDLVLCMTDTHARLNGHTEPAIRTYFEDISNAAKERDMRTVFLSRLTEHVLPSEVELSLLSCDVMAELERCALKWYRGSADPREGARQYVDQNMVERKAIEKALPSSIFVTFNGSQYRPIFPISLPVFYMYSLRKGTSVKPWFMDADGTAFSASSVSGALHI